MVRRASKMILDLIDYFVRIFERIIYRQNRPPYSLRAFVGPAEDFERMPQEFIAYFKLLCGVKMDQTILDIGCGPGRFALQLIIPPNFFSGEYHGFDIHKKAINWARTNITSSHRNFSFECIDLLNCYYNPHGKLKAETFKFPYDDEKFDFVFAYSIFTHLLPDVVVNYLSEINRVLKPNCKALLTFFLLNGYPETINEIGRKRYPKHKPIKWHHYDIYAVAYPDHPEKCVAYQETAVKDMIEKSSLHLEKTYYGGWHKADDYLSSQDIIIVGK